MMWKKKQENKSEKKRGFVFGAAANTVNQGYESSVVARAVKRAGKNVNIKGHINEIRTVDRMNFNLGNIIKGNRAKLTKSTNAVRDDIVLMNKGKVMKRFQLKDTTSVSGAGKTAKQIVSGKYNKTNVIGTVETAKAVNNTKVMEKAGKRIIDNGLRSVDNERMAARAVNFANGIKKTASLAASGVGSSVKKGIVFTAGVESVKNANKIRKGEESLGEGAYNVGKETAISAGSTAAACFTGEVVALTVGTVCSVPALCTAASVAVGMGAAMAVDKGQRVLIEHGEKTLSNMKENRENTDMDKRQ